jgi:release factor glutamine methyltransferase
LVKRRSERVPLQHLVGSVSFNGLELDVNGDVLIPRPETEILSQLAVRRLSSLKKPAPIALDFGSGSGCLAISLAVGVPGAMVHAIDCSDAAIAVARRNAQRHGVADLIQFHLGDGFAALPRMTQPFDLLVSNPPYISTGEIETLDPEVRDHDPRLALDGGVDGLDFYRRLAAEAPAFLQPGAPVLLEFGDGQEDDLRRLFSAPGWVFETIENDLSGRPRIVIARRAT